MNSKKSKLTYSATYENLKTVDMFTFKQAGTDVSLGTLKSKIGIFGSGG